MIKVFEAFANKTNFSGRFLIGGKPHLTFNLRPSDKRVVFLGIVEDRDLGYLYAHSIALFFATRYEGFGLPILEAMNLQVSVITSTISSMPEVGGDAALFVDPDNISNMADALEILAFDKLNRIKCIESENEQIKKAGKNVLERWSQCIRKFKQIFS